MKKSETRTCHSASVKSPSFVSADMFCALRKVRVDHHALARVGIDVIYYATKYMTKVKIKFSYWDQIKFNEPALKPGIPE